MSNQENSKITSKNLKAYRIAIVGAGALGTGIGATLVKDFGADVSLKGREGWIDEVRKVDFLGVTEPVCFRLPDSLKFDLVFVCTKSVDFSGAIDEISAFLQGPAVVVSLCNGMLWDEVCAGAQKFKKHVWRIGASYLGVKLSADRTYQLSHRDWRSVWGGVSSEPMTGVEEVLCSLPHFHYVENPLAAVREKWLFNTVINGLCGLHQLKRNGDLLARKEEVQGLLQEVYLAAAKKWGPWPKALADYAATMQELIKSTQGNENSLVRDLRLGKPLETPYLAGILSDMDSPSQLLKRVQELS